LGDAYFADSNLVMFVSLNGFLGSGARQRTVSIVAGQAYRSQRDAIAASGTMIVVVLQRYHGYARLGAALGTGYKGFTSCHTRTSFLSRADARPEKASSSETLWRNPPDLSLPCSKEYIGLQKHLDTKFE
jgi:hypothetical protein